MDAFQNNWVNTTAERAFRAIKRDIQLGDKCTLWGEVQGFYTLGNTFRQLEVTLETKDLAEYEKHYSVQLHCSEGEYDAGQYEDTLGIIGTICTVEGKVDWESLRTAIRNAVILHAETLPPMIFELNTFANQCGYFHNAYLTDGVSFNNGYNCRHFQQKDTHEENGKIFGGCHCWSCPLGYSPSNSELLKYGVIEEADLEEEDGDDSSNSDYIVVTDSETVWKLRSKTKYGLAVKVPYWEERSGEREETAGADVYVLYAVTAQTEFTDSHGESAQDETAIVGIYSTEARAKAEKASLEKEDANNVALFDTDPVVYRIESYTVR